MQISKALDANKVAEARLPELLQIHDLGKALDPERYGVKGLPSALRRRTRSHNSYKHAKRPRVGADDGDKQAKMMNRKMRRKEQFRTYQGNPFVTSKGTTSALEKVYLPTHVFHAKRMTMGLRFGRFVLPEGLPGKGHGTRSFTHKLNNGCIIHDMSYWCSIEVVLGEGVETAVQMLVEQTARGRHPLLRSFQNKTGDSSSTSSDTDTVTLWAHCLYAEEAVAMVHKLQNVDASRTTVGRLGRMELRGPRSSHVFQKAVAALKDNCPQYQVLDVEGMEGSQGFGVVAPRDAYPRLFVGICLTGGVLVCGQREWHWYQTMCGRRFYPDDYELEVGDGERDEEGTDADGHVAVRVWVRKKGVLVAGMKLMDSAGVVVGCITSAKPRMISNKYCSIGSASARLFDNGKGGVKQRLTARLHESCGKPGIDVTVRLI